MNQRFAPVIPTFLFLVTCAPVSAYDWSNDYGANLTVGFDDNFRLDEDDEIDTTSTDLGVFADIQGATELSTIRLAIGANGTTYSESEIEDEISYNVSMDAARSGERLSSFVNVRFESEVTTESELLDTGFLEEDGTRDTISVSPGLLYQVNERNSVSAILGYRDVSYDTVSLTEYTDNSVTLSWSYQLDEMSSVATGVTHTVYDPDDDDDTETDSVFVSYERQTSEATTYNYSVGFTDVDQPDGSEDGSTYAFGVNHRTDERNSFTLGLSKSYEGSGDGEVRDEDRLNMQWNHGLSDRAQFTLSAEGVNTDDRDFYSIQAGSNYQYSPEVSLSASYRYRERDEGAEDADSNAVFFSLSYSPI